ncbi:MAG: DEAD/DEAH box helicase [Bdellovibrionales bacterium]|nr:DEAD/DEAH box helicase [Oligoflexia bacterium]
MESFDELKLAPVLDKAIKGMKFSVPTPIQRDGIPVAMSGRDLIACAQTGSGKTVAFGVPILSRLLEHKMATALVLVPTRELAVQVTDVFRQLTFHAPQIRIVNLIGGVSLQPQLRALQTGYRVLIATPGRLLDHLERKSVHLDHLQVLTLDEADRMLDMGFAPQLREIFKYLPKVHQTLLFSATMPPNILLLTKSILKNPAEIKVNAVSQAAPKIDQQTREVKQTEKSDAILTEVKKRKGSILIFTRTQKRADRLTQYLEKHQIFAACIHGGRTQGQRNRALDAFRDGEARILVATDIAGRGIDIDHVAHVINLDLPQVPEDYVHRIGRTARAGREGQALSLISPEERGLWKDIQTLLNGKTADTQAHSGARANHAFGHGPGTQADSVKRPAKPKTNTKRKFSSKRARPSR